MNSIVTIQDVVTAFADFMEPTNAELDAIEQEIPAILAEVDLLDAQIIALNHTPNEVDAKRVRRAFSSPGWTPRWATGSSRPVAASRSRFKPCG